MIQKIQDALKKLDVNNGNHWTADGLPRLDTVKMLAADQSITREIIASAAPGFSRSNPTFSQTTDNAIAVKSDGAAVGNPELTPVVEKAVEEPAIVSRVVLEDNNAEIADLLNAQKIKVEKLRQEKFKLDEVFEIERRKEDALREQYEKMIGVADTNTSAIQEYLASQQKTLAERAARKQIIRESGIDLKQLQRDLRSPLDAALARKTSRGSQRPGS